MRQPQIIKKQPITLFDSLTRYGTTPETEICLECTEKRCNGNCKHFKEEMRKLKKIKKVSENEQNYNNREHNKRY